MRIICAIKRKILGNTLNREKIEKKLAVLGFYDFNKNTSNNEV